MDKVRFDYHVARAIERIKRSEYDDWMGAALAAMLPQKGSIVKVFRGRKVPRGTTGRVIWTGDGHYGDRVGLIPDGSEEPVWTAASNVSVMSDPDLLPYMEDFQASNAERQMKAAAYVTTHQDDLT